MRRMNAARASGEVHAARESAHNQAGLATTNPVVVRGGRGPFGGSNCNQRLPSEVSTFTSIPAVFAIADARIPGVDRTACLCLECASEANQHTRATQGEGGDDKEHKTG